MSLKNSDKYKIDKRKLFKPNFRKINKLINRIPIQKIEALNFNIWMIRKAPNLDLIIFINLKIQLKDINITDLIKIPDKDQISEIDKKLIDPLDKARNSQILLKEEDNKDNQ